MLMFKNDVCKEIKEYFMYVLEMRLTFKEVLNQIEADVYYLNFKIGFIIIVLD